MARVLSCPVCESWVFKIPHVCADGTVPGRLLFEGSRFIRTTSNRNDLTMAKGKKREIKEHEIEMMSGTPIPPRLKRSKYPWDKLADADAAAINFFCKCDTEEEATRLRTSVYSSGSDYYLKRKIPRKPDVHVMQNENGDWGVAAWAVESTD